MEPPTLSDTRIFLPWPPRALSPNSRVHWGKRNAAASQAKMDGFIAALEAGAKQLRGTSEAWTITYTFHPPDNRRRDDDNFIASMKPFRDGIAEALRIDDSAFRTAAVRWGDVRANGMVIAELEAV